MSCSLCNGEGEVYQDLPPRPAGWYRCPCGAQPGRASAVGRDRLLPPARHRVSIAELGAAVETERKLGAELAAFACDCPEHDSEVL